MTNDVFLMLNEKLSKEMTIEKFLAVADLNLFNFLQCIKTAKISDKKEIKSLLICHICNKGVKIAVEAFDLVADKVYPDDHKLFFKINEIADKIVFEASNLEGKDINILIERLVANG